MSFSNGVQQGPVHIDNILGDIRVGRSTAIRKYDINMFHPVMQNVHGLRVLPWLIDRDKNLEIVNLFFPDFYFFRVDGSAVG